jgi:hypothetical protein
VYLTEDADGQSLALTTTLEDGTSQKAAGQRRGLREQLPRRDGATGGP